MPVLLINAPDDFSAPLETQRRFLELLGSPAEHKRHVAIEGGHVPNDRLRFFREVLDWCDTYFGSVNSLTR